MGDLVQGMFGWQDYVVTDDWACWQCVSSGEGVPAKSRTEPLRRHRDSPLISGLWKWGLTEGG